MKKKIPLVPALFFLALAALMVSGMSCNLLLPFGSYTAPTTYKCTAQFYRTVGAGQEFTENWQAWIWPVDMDNDGTIDDTDALLLCQQKANNYMSQIMAPGFTWHYRNLAVSTDPKPVVHNFCPPDWPIYGAPVGNDMAVWNPDASFEIWYTDPNTNQPAVATATAKNANFVYAERTGLPRGVFYPETQTGYNVNEHHIRISDFRVEFDNWSAGDVYFNYFFIQSIGTIFAEDVGGGSYRIYPQKGKFYLEAQLVKDGDTKTTNTCFANSVSADIKAIDYGSPMLGFNFLNYGNLPGFESITIQEINVHFSSGGTDPFQQHQPAVYLNDRTWHTTSGYLTFSTGDIIGDADYNLDTSKFLWFENFEQAGSETFLGNNLILPVNLSWGKHRITVVVYDTMGSYATSTMTLNIQRLPGDVDGDGQVCSKDIQIITQNLGHKVTGPNDPYAPMDINGNGVVDIGDVRAASTLCSHPTCACQ